MFLESAGVRRWLFQKQSEINESKMILPALAEAENPFWRPIKYSLFSAAGAGNPCFFFIAR